MIPKCSSLKREPTPRSLSKTVSLHFCNDVCQLLVSLILLYLVPSPDVEPMINRVTEGMDAIFTVKLSDAIAGKTFQWQLDEEDIIGEQARMTSLTITNVTEMDEGNYTYIVMFSLLEGNITSNRAQLLVCKLVIIISMMIFCNVLSFPNSFTSCYQHTPI